MKNQTKEHNYTYNITPYIYYYIYLIKKYKNKYYINNKININYIFNNLNIKQKNTYYLDHESIVEKRQ